MVLRWDYSAPFAAHVCEEQQCPGCTTRGHQNQVSSLQMGEHLSQPFSIDIGNASNPDRCSSSTTPGIPNLSQDSMVDNNSRPPYLAEGSKLQNTPLNMVHPLRETQPRSSGLFQNPTVAPSVASHSQPYLYQAEAQYIFSEPWASTTSPSSTEIFIGGDNMSSASLSAPSRDDPSCGSRLDEGFSQLRNNKREDRCLRCKVHRCTPCQGKPLCQHCQAAGRGLDLDDVGDGRSCWRMAPWLFVNANSMPMNPNNETAVTLRVEFNFENNNTPTDNRHNLYMTVLPRLASGVLLNVDGLDAIRSCVDFDCLDRIIGLGLLSRREWNSYRSRVSERSASALWSSMELYVGYMSLLQAPFNLYIHGLDEGSDIHVATQILVTCSLRITQLFDQLLTQFEGYLSSDSSRPKPRIFLWCIEILCHLTTRICNTRWGLGPLSSDHPLVMFERDLKLLMYRMNNIFIGFECRMTGECKRPRERGKTPSLLNFAREPSMVSVSPIQFTMNASPAREDKYLPRSQPPRHLIQILAELVVASNESHLNHEAHMGPEDMDLDMITSYYSGITSDMSQAVDDVSNDGSNTNQIALFTDTSNEEWPDPLAHQQHRVQYSDTLTENLE